MDDPRRDQLKLSAYVGGRLLERLGLAGKPFAIEPAPAGIHSRVFYLSIQGHPQLVLKIIPRRQRFRAAVACARHLAHHGIASPGIVWADEDSRFFNRRGMHVLCEERIVGPSLERLSRTPELIIKVAQLYAGMHAVARSTWGDIGRGSAGGLYAYLRKKILQRLDGWSRSDDLPAGQREKIVAAFAAGEPAVGRITSFSLSHTDPNRNNLILRDGDDRLFLLDTGSLRYLPRAIDYFMLQAYFCFNNPGHAALFEETYMQGLTPRQRQEFQETQEFFKLYVIILFVHDLTTRFAALDRASPYYDEFSGLIPQAKHALAQQLEAT